MKPRSAAFVLIEMIVAISLCLIVFAAAGTLAMRVVRVQKSAVQAEWDTSHWSSALRELQADVWCAQRVTVEPGDSLRLDIDGAVVRWYTADADDALNGDEAGPVLVRWVETPGTSEPETYHLPTLVSFDTATPTGLMLKVGDRSLELPSQVAILAARRPAP